MAKKNTLIIAGLAAGAYAYLRKAENRDKAMAAFNSTKEKVNELLSQTAATSTDEKDVETVDDREQVAYGADPDTDPDKSYYLRDRDMVGEGAMTTVQYYNEGKQEEVDGPSEHDNEDNQNKTTLDSDKPSPKVAAPKLNYRPNGINDQAEDGVSNEHLRDRDMLSEGGGAGTTVQYYNEQQEKNK